jgi:aminoglycoside phosphotransferase (APT) family kinase protein
MGQLFAKDQQKIGDIVVRIQPEGAAVFPDCDVGTQYRTMQLLQGSGLPVPPLLGLEMDVAVLGAPFFIMGRLAGQVPDENPLYHLQGWFHDLPVAQLRQHWFAGIDGIAMLAKLDWRALGFTFLLPPKGITPLAKQLAYTDHMLQWSEGLANRRYPLLWRAANWLKANQPQTAALALSWGDAKLGNCVFHQAQLVGMLDWERPALANPVDDLSWWLMLDESLCTGYGVPRLAGLPSRAETIAHWECASGFSAHDLPYYDVLSAWRFAIIMTRIGRIFTERGWVTAEAEMDLCNGGSRLVELLAERHQF